MHTNRDASRPNRAISSSASVVSGGYGFSGSEKQVRNTSIRRLLLLLSAAMLLMLYATAVFAQAVPLVTTPVATFPTPVPVSSSDSLTVTLNFTASGTPAVIEAVTAGATGLDFSIGTGGTCSTTASYSAGNSCTVVVNFVPLYPGVRIGAVRAKTSASGSLLAETLVQGNSTGALPALKPGTMSTVAGTDSYYYAADGQAAVGSTIFIPKSAVVDGTGNLYISDTGNSRIRWVDTSGVIHTYAGSYSVGYSGDGGQATSAAINQPAGLALDGAGNLYFSDNQNNVVRRVDGVTHIITTVAGVAGSSGYNGDGIAATSAQLYSPESLAFDASGNLLIADAGNNRIRKVDAVSGNISTVAGINQQSFSGDGGLATAAALNDPKGVSVAADGTIFIADTGNARIRKIDPTTSNISTIVGTSYAGWSSDDGGPASSATLNNPVNVTVDPAGDVYIVDASNNRIRMINASTGKIETLVGGTETNFSGDGGPADKATIHGPNGLYFTPTGDIYFTDLLNNRVRKVSVQALTLNYATMKVGKTSAPQIEGLINEGNTNLALSNYVASQAGLDTATTTCTFGSGATALTPGVACNLGVEFMPTQVASPDTGTLSLPSNATSITPLITLTGNVLSVNPTTIAVAVQAPSTNPSILGDAVTFRATVAQVTSDGTTPTGTVTFLDGTATLGTATLAQSGSASASATLTTSSLTIGTHSITATYPGDTSNAAGTSNAVSQVVTRLPSVTTLAALPSPLSAFTAVTLSAQVLIDPSYTSSSTLTGTVTFTDNGTVIGSAPVASSGAATYSFSGFTAGSHTVVAQYSGDTNYDVSSASRTAAVGQTSAIINVTVNTPSQLAGKPASFTAAVSSTTGTPTGSVTFQEGGNLLGTANLNNGVASFSTSVLSVGTHVLTATYTGDTNYSTVTSAAFQQQVTLATTTLALTGPAAPVVITTAAGFTATLASPGVTPTGTLTLYDGATAIATQTLTGSSPVAFSISTLAVGTHSMTVHYSGDNDNAAATSNAVAVVVKLADTGTVLVTSGTPGVLGNTVTFTASVSSSIANLTGTVSLLDGGQTIGTAALVNGTVVFNLTTLAFGDHTLTASYSGDAQHAASTSAALAQRILQAASVGLVSSLNPALSGQQITWTAAVPGAAGLVPTGVVTFSDGATVLGTATLNAAGQATMQSSSLTVGTHTLHASYAGDNNFSTAEASLTQTVNLATTHVTIAISSDPATFGAVTDLTATVQSDGGAATGTVQFTEAGTVLGAATLNGSGVAVLHIATLTPGRHTVVANYISDGKAAAGVSSALGFLVKQQTTLVLSSSANPALTLDHVTLTATLQSAKAVAATGSVTFLDGGTVLGTAALDGNGVATLDVAPMTVGTHGITATYAGDDADFPATAAAMAQVVSLRATRTTVSYSSTNTADPQQVTLFVVVQSPTPSSVASPSGSVTLYNGSTVVGTVTLDANGTGALTIRLQTGQTDTITANYPGDSAFAASTSAATTVKAGAAAQFNLTLSSAAVNVQRAQHLTISVTASSIQGFSDSLKMGCVGLPYGATCTFTTTGGSVSTAMNLPSNGSGTMQLMIDTGNPLGSGSTGTTSTSAALQHARNAVLCLLPACLLLCGKHRRRRLWPVLLLFAATAASLGTSGCGGLKINSTPAGTYTFQVTAVGQGSGITESQTVTLTVTE